MHSPKMIAKPGKRRVYSNHGFQVFAETSCKGPGSNSWQYLSEAVFEPLGMTDSSLEGGAEAAGYGATSTVADLAAFAGDLLRPATVSRRCTWRRRRAVPRSDGVLPGFGGSGPTTGGWASRSATASRHTGPARRTRAAPTVISASPGRSCGSIRTLTSRWWCSPTGISASGRTRGGQRYRTES